MSSSSLYLPLTDLYSWQRDRGRRGLGHHCSHPHPHIGEGGLEVGDLGPVLASGSVVDARVQKGLAVEDEISSQGIDQHDGELADASAVPKSFDADSIPVSAVS